MDSSTEFSELEQQVIEQLFSQYNAILDSKGAPSDEPDETEVEYKFALDRQEDTNSRFTADSISITGLQDQRLEEYSGAPILTQEGEKWIQISVNPRDPYRPKLGFFTQKGREHYLTERLEIFLSSNGRGYQASVWAQALRPDQHTPQIPRISYLREYPKKGEMTKLDYEPDEGTIEPFSPIHEESVVRLKDILLQLKKGNIIE